jgi:hypothetical protein
MVKISSITVLGFLVIVTHFMGIYREWADIAYIIYGLLIIILSLSIRKELHKVMRIVHGLEEPKVDTYVENHPQ